MNARDERTKSLWMSIKVAPGARPLQHQVKADTVVIGAGIAGLSVAYELSELGQKVVVLDRGPVAGGMTGRTTAHLAPVCDDGLSTLIGLRGEKLARRFHLSQCAAVDRIEAIVERYDIDCDFRRLDGLLFPALGMKRDEARKQLGRELEAAGRVGAEALMATGAPFKGFKTAPVLRYPHQATFHPLKYLRVLADVVVQRKGLIFDATPVVAIEESKSGVRVETEAGVIVVADQAVVATNTPINDRMALHSKMAPYRTYAMAFELPRGTLPDGLYWDMAEPYHYVRLHPGRDGTDHLIVGGEDHKAGEANDGERRFGEIEKWIRRLLPATGRQTHRWSGQVMTTLDHCAYIGRNPGNTRIFVATGDSGQGMTHGVVAGLLLKDLLAGRPSPWSEVYKPSRKSLRAIGTYIEENMTVVRNMAERVLPGDIRSVDELQPGQGGILQSGGHRLAACRDGDGKLYVRSSICSHLGCHVNWNATEQCWDCPCHGSHFAPDGSVLNGPAIAPLALVDAPVAARRRKTRRGR